MKSENGHQPDPTARVPAASTLDKELVYASFGDEVQIRLTISIVRNQLCTPTKKGKRPSDVDCILFMKVCEARRLNPWLKDAFLVGYDIGESGAKFEVITAVQALYKRAELHQQYDGIESGVIVKRGDTVSDVIGDFILPGDTLVGGWAIVHRKDRNHPSVERVNFSTFNTGQSRWTKDPCGMISKCAEAGALRKAFPSDIGGLYIEQEMERSAMQIERAAISYTPTVQTVQADPDSLSVENPDGPPEDETFTNLSARIADIPESRTSYPQFDRWLQAFEEGKIDAAERDTLDNQLATKATELSEPANA